MKVTVCSNCGTKNPAGSKFCNSCGESLTSDTRQICPNCQTPNPNHLLYCDNCGTRLADEHLPEEEKDGSSEPSSPTNRSKPFSLPSRPQGETANLEVSGEIPDWLKTGEGAETEGEDTDKHLPEWARAAQESGDEWEDDEAPTLDDISGDHRPTDDLPVWLLDEDLPDTIFTKDKSTDELFEALSADAESGKTKETAEELPDWLQGLASGTGPLPTLPGESDSVETGDEEQGWSSEMDHDEEIVAEHPDDLEETSPAAREDRKSSQPAEEEVRAEETIPDWLADLEGEPTETEAAVSDQAESGAVEEMIPDWLADLEAESAESEVDIPGSTESADPEDTGSDWLANLQSGSPEVEESDETVPGWLEGLDVTEDERDMSEAPFSAEAEESVPEWLAQWAAGTAQTSAARDEELASDLNSEEQAESTAADSTFDLLADLEAGAAASEPAADESPDEKAAGLEESHAEAEVPAEEPSGPSAEAEIPDWLAALDAEEFAEDVDSSFESEEKEEGDFPDWLAGLGVEVTESSAVEETDAFVDEDQLPDWLREADEVEATSEPTADAEDIPPWLQEGDTELSTEAELPDWLMETEAAASLRPTIEEEEELDEAVEAERDQAETPGEVSAEVTAEELPEEPAEVSAEVVEEVPAEEPLEQAEEEPDQTADEEQVDWLSELGILENDEPKAPAPEISPATEVPEWLRAMAPPDTGSLVPGEETVPIGEDVDDFLDDLDSEELPEWLTEGEAEAIEAPGQDELAPTDELEGVDEEALSDWFSAAELTEDELSFSAPEETPPSEPPTEAEVEETVPVEPSQEEEAEEMMGSFAPSDDLPDWLGDVMFDIDESDPFAFDEDEEIEAPLPPSAEVEGVPDTLAGDELPGWLEDSFPETVEGEMPAEPTPLEELPEWLRPPGGTERVSLTEDEKWGDLLDELPPPEEAGQELSEAEIPEWLRALEPRQLVEEREPDEEVSEQVPESGPLAGLAGVIAIEPTIAEAASARSVSDYTVSKEQHQQAALLQQLIRTVPQETVQVGPEKAHVRFPLPQILLALLLLAAMVTGFFLPTLVEPEPPAATGLLEAQTLVTEVAPGPVLVAFDYTPAMAGALDAHASLLLRELAATGSPILVVSQSAAGLALGEQTVTEISELDSLPVGYIPGGPLGLRRLASCLEESAGCDSIYGRPLSAEAGESLAESALIIVLAGDQESLLSWIEQVAAPTEIPLLAVVPQAIAPVAAPYYASGQLAGLLSGSPTAVVAQLAGDQTSIGDGEGQVTALALGQWLVIGLLLIGNLFYLFTGTVGDRREGTV